VGDGRTNLLELLYYSRQCDIARYTITDNVVGYTTLDNVLYRPGRAAGGEPV